MISKETFVIALALGCTATFFLGRFSAPGAPAPAAAPATPAPTADTRAEPAVEVATVEVAAAAPTPAAGAAASPSKGPEHAKVTIVEISDFECPFCSRAVPTLAQITAKWPEDVRIVFKHNPLGFHQRAMPAALASMAAFRQGRFWEMHDKLFANQQALSDADLKRYATELGLDLATFEADMKDPALRRQITNEQAGAVAAGQQGTPAFLINGKALVGAQPLAQFQSIIESELAAADQLLAGGTPLAQVHRERARANLGARFTAYWDGLVGARPVAAPAPAPQAAKARPDLPPQDTTIWKAPVQGHEPTKGPDDALVTLVEFTDFECPFCSKLLPTLDKLRERYPDDVRIVFKNAPLPFHERAVPAARAALAAGEQGKFWPMHDKLFANQDALGDSDLAAYAAELGLDMERWRADLASPAIAARIEKDREAAALANTSSTPTVYVNGVKVEGALPYERFESVVEDALAKARQVVAGGTPKGQVYERIMTGAKVFEVLDERVHGFTTSGSPVLGAREGDIEVVAFGDFECPFSGRLVPNLKALVADPALEGRVKVVFKHYPLRFHRHARPAAMASLAALEQGKFWPMHDRLFENPKALSGEDLRKHADQVGLDLAKYDEFMREQKGARTIDRDLMEAGRSGARGTPSVYINGRKFEPPAGYSVDAFKDAIAKNFPAP